MKPMMKIFLPSTLAGREQLSNFSCRPNAYKKGLSEEPPWDWRRKGHRKKMKWINHPIFWVLMLVYSIISIKFWGYTIIPLYRTILTIFGYFFGYFWKPAIPKSQRLNFGGSIDRCRSSSQLGAVLVGAWFSISSLGNTKRDDEWTLNADLIT